MQLNRMDCSGRSNNIERDTDLGDDLSPGDHSDDGMRDCDSVEAEHLTRSARLNISAASNGGNMSFGVGGTGRSPDHQTEMQLGHHHQFPPNHPLNALGNFMGIGGLHGIPNLQHNDVLEKLKMQVRDMKVGLMEQDYAVAHAAAFGANVLPTPINTAFTLPPTTMASFGHTAQSMTSQTGGGGGGGNSVANGNINAQNVANTSSAASALSNGGAAGGGTGGGGGGGGGVVGGGGGGSGNSFSFTSPTAPSTKDVNPASNSSTSSDTSNSSQQNNGWSFEEQYKQVRQLYEINDDPKRKEFLDDLFSFMQKRGTPINRLPIMAKSVLDLYELYNLVIARGGLVDVINKKLWQEIIKGLHLPSSITSAAFTLRTQYMKYLYPYECEKKNLSSPAELQAAIDGNRREGRRSSYGQYEAMHNQMQMPQMARQSLPGGMQQMSPLALVTHAAANNQQAQAAAAAAAAHHRLMAPTFGQMPNLMTHEIEQRMMEYLKLIQVKKEQNAVAAAAAGGAGGSGVGAAGGGIVAVASHQHQQQQQQQQRQRSQSPEITTREALNALEMSRVALWQMYHNNTSPPASVNTSPQGVGGSAGLIGAGSGGGVEPQRSEALNLSDSPPNLPTIKREREREPSPEPNERDDFQHQPPPAKRLGAGIMPPGFPNFYLQHGMAAAAAAASYHHATHDSDAEHEEEDNEEDEGEHNITANSSAHDDQERQHLNGHNNNNHHHHHNQLHRRHHHSNSGHHDKSDDSAIENSPSTSAASAGNGHISPVSTKKIHLSKPQSNGDENGMSAAVAASGPLEALSLLSGMQFRVERNGTGANGEQQLVVNLELNGIKYTGLLIANTATPTLEAANSSNSTNCSEHNQEDDAMETEATHGGGSEEDQLAENAATAETPAKGLLNGPSNNPTLMEPLLST